MIGKVSSSSETQETEIEYRVMELVNLPTKVLKNRRAKSLVNALNLTSTIGFKPRPLIMFLTLKLVFDSDLEPLVKFAFGLIRGLYKEYLREKNPGRPKTPRRSYRLSQNTEQEKKEIFDWICYKTDKNIIESPSFSDRTSNSLQGVRESEVTKKHSLRSVSKIFLRFLLKRFQVFKHFGFSKISKKTVLKNFCNRVSSILYRPMFNSLLRYCSIKRLKEDSGNVVKEKQASKLANSTNQDTLMARRPSFELKDKELWRKRHPIRQVSPCEVYTRYSFVPSADCVSPILPRHRRSIIRKNKRRNTASVPRKIESPQESDVSEVVTEKSKELTPVIRKNKKGLLRSQKKEPQKSKKLNEGVENVEKVEEAEKDFVKKPKKKDFFASQPVAKAKKIENMGKVIAKNWKNAKGQAIFLLHQFAQKQKELDKSNAAKLMNDFLSYKAIQLKKTGKKVAFESIKKEASMKKPQKILKKPEKKGILRAGRHESPKNSLELPHKTLDPDRGKKFQDSLDFLHTSILKTKLSAFLAIIEASNSNKKPQTDPLRKSALRSLFRILETKKFLNICRIFHSLKRKSAQRHKQMQKKYLKISQTLIRIFPKRLKDLKITAFTALHQEFQRKKAKYRLIKALTKVENRVRLLVKPIVWYSICNYMKRQFYNSKVKMMKTEFLVRKRHIRKLASAFVRWENYCQRARRVSYRPSSTHGVRVNNYRTTSGFYSRESSPMHSPLSTKTNFRSPSNIKILPQPKDIHDYIDDLYEVSKGRVETVYLPRSPNAVRAKQFTFTK